MTPAARTQAALELLAAMRADLRPPELQLSNYFRTRRYAGSGDRAAISEMVFGVLRRWGELIWRLHGPAGERLMLAAYLRHVEGLNFDDVAARFDGSPYGPKALAEDEIGGLRSALDSGDPPAWARGNYPAWLDPLLDQAFGADKSAEMAALNERAPFDLRVNTLKSDRDKVLAKLAKEDIAATAGALSPLCVRLAKRRRMENHALVKNGHVEVQDEGSQVLALLCGARPGWQVVDYCAGAGGKTLALAAAMAGKGQLYAFDIDGKRLARLKPRQKRAGAHNVQPHILSGAVDKLAASLRGACQRVLVDAPCSGSGAWRRQPGAGWRLSEKKLAKYQDMQQKILHSAAALVAPGGRLIYTTCSVLKGENEEQVAAFLARHDDFILLPYSGVWEEALGTAPPGGGEMLNLTPLKNGTDGFFGAVLQRAATTLDSSHCDP
jgi:16S rRNA (cytosine967-C5)-methyltransferase